MENGVVAIKFTEAYAYMNKILFLVSLVLKRFLPLERKKFKSSNTVC